MAGDENAADRARDRYGDVHGRRVQRDRQARTSPIRRHKTMLLRTGDGPGGGHARSGALSRALAILPLGLLQSGLESGQDAEEPSQDEVAIVKLHGRDSGVG